MFGRAGNRRDDARRLMALDALRTNVMIADENLTITHMNRSLLTLMREAESDLKNELPRFDVASLIGSNIDIFHKNPLHQRNMLAVLEKPHNATIRIGTRVFDLLVTPLFEDRKRIGFAVEWTDAKQRLLNLDYAPVIAAINKSQAMIEFATDGTILDANANFLQAMGYTLAEIRGKHHRIFVEPAYQSSREYTAFWDALRRGEFQAGQYKRYGKNGKEVWIEGAYNPIIDPQGKVQKVVKFATDITVQARLLAKSTARSTSPTPKRGRPPPRRAKPRRTFNRWPSAWNNSRPRSGRFRAAWRVPDPPPIARSIRSSRWVPTPKPWPARHRP